MSDATANGIKEKARAVLVRHGLAGGEVEQFNTAEQKQLAEIDCNSAAELGRVLVAHRDRLEAVKATSEVDEQRSSFD